MIVTFISQCEKKAIPRTRRVLDAFADRIGDNTWQTIITEDGLIAVKKLLRKTVTKSTAVSCHWIRGRRRSELLWVVGNRNKFNEIGVVPVNSTKKDVFMDIVTMKAKQDEFYANTHLQPLAEHSFAIGYLAQQLFKNVVDNEEYENLSKVAFLAGCLHDLGKIDINFQDWLRNPKNKDYEAEDGQHIDTVKNKRHHLEDNPSHNELSLLIFHFFDSISHKKINTTNKELIKHTIYWHHAKFYRKNDKFKDVESIYNIYKSSLKEDKFNQFFHDALKILKRINQISQNYDGNNIDIFDVLPWFIDDQELHSDFLSKKHDLPKFKAYDINKTKPQEIRSAIDISAEINIVRACVISADRIISNKEKISAQTLLEYIAEKRLDELLEQHENLSDLKSHLINAETIFPDSERTKKQNAIAKELSEVRDAVVLAGPAGCGKTKIALEWAKLKDAKKIFWICPRVQVCQGIFQELTESYLPDAKVEIFTGEFKFTNAWDKVTPDKEYLSGDVVVTTIDQILGSIVTHSKVDSLIPFMDAHIIFDEYHEYIGMEIFNILFAELVANKRMNSKNKRNTLLISATPHYYYLKNVLDFKIEKEFDNNQLIEMESFNDCDYKIEFIDYDESVIAGNPFYQSYNGQTFIISNTALTAQLGFIYQKNQEKSVLFHSKFKRSDKKNWFNEVYEAFKKEGTHKFDVLRSGPIVQASLNITAKNMLTEMTSPENMLQRLGRLDRFGESESLNILKVAITENVKNGSCKGSLAYFLNQLNCLQTTKAWYDFLQDQLAEQSFKLSKLYQLYKDFHEQQDQENSAVSQDMQKALKKSIDRINNKVTEPTKVSKPKTAERKSKISKNSLRGDSRFVQLAKLNLNDFNKPIFENKYAYEPPLDDKTEYDNLTESLNNIQGISANGSRKSDKDLVAHMFKKHHNIMSEKKVFSDNVLINLARDPDFPIYLSYIPEHLDKVGGNAARHTHAIYYAVCDQQPIGLLSLETINFLTQKKEGK